ncbi:MAG: hypothetical protein R2742_14235 [Micropruina glycogenica]
MRVGRTDVGRPHPRRRPHHPHHPPHAGAPAQRRHADHQPGRGARTYLAVRGGFDVPAVLGSRASDVLSGIGPAP